jgi:hypothetical protein
MGLSERPYPEGIDCVWLASDREGHLGAFITAGVGPIPAEALKSDYVPVEDIEGLVCDMPHVSGARLLVSVKRPDDFVDLAERGVFVYDWTDIHRTARDAVRAYEPVAVPVKPIKVDVLPADLAAVAQALKFVDVAFADEKRLDVRVYMGCHEGE